MLANIFRLWFVGRWKNAGERRKIPRRNFRRGIALYQCFTVRRLFRSIFLQRLKRKIVQGFAAALVQPE